MSNINHEQNQGLTMSNVRDEKTSEEIRSAIKIDGDAVLVDVEVTHVLVLGLDWGERT